MYKELSIVIPHYKETQKQMFPLLSSLHSQIGIDFEKLECIIVTDGGGLPLELDFLEFFDNLSIRMINLPENVGPGLARQAGLDEARGEYVLFCDADDIIHSVGVIGAFLLEARQHKPDIVITSWLEEIYDSTTKAYSYITHVDGATWLHGKLIRRQFIVDKNIRFHDTLKIHEDSYFLAIANALTSKRIAGNFTSYVWKYGENSITRCNNAAYTYESMPEFMRSIELALQRISKEAPQEMLYKVVQITMYTYFLTHSENWLIPEHEHYRKDVENAFRKLITPYLPVYHSAPKEFIHRVYNEERNKNFAGGIEQETLETWLTRVVPNGDK